MHVLEAMFYGHPYRGSNCLCLRHQAGHTWVLADTTCNPSKRSPLQPIQNLPSPFLQAPYNNVAKTTPLALQHSSTCMYEGTSKVCVRWMRTVLFQKAGIIDACASLHFQSQIPKQPKIRNTKHTTLTQRRCCLSRYPRHLKCVIAGIATTHDVASLRSLLILNGNGHKHISDIFELIILCRTWLCIIYRIGSNINFAITNFKCIKKSLRQKMSYFVHLHADFYLQEKEKRYNLILEQKPTFVSLIIVEESFICFNWKLLLVFKIFFLHGKFVIFKKKM